jgi:FKBP-type peptidyl-prolyl cis-trans isomerase FkpA
MRPFLLVLSAALLVSCSSAPESKPPEEKSSTGTPTPAPAPAASTLSPEAFLAQAAAEPGAVKTASGLVYREITPGTGASPKPTDPVTVNYRGTLTNGTEFDSSYKRNEPMTIPLNQLVPCWIEGIQKMKVGGKSKLVCPASLAYGDAGVPQAGIAPGATLAFEVELLKIGR